MNKTAIKNFATFARRRLIEDVSQKAHYYGVLGNDNILPAKEIEGGIEIQEVKGSRRIDNHNWMGNLYDQRQKLIRQISLKGYEQVIEEVAYTWFNRIIAIRFMEVNGYLPLKIRVLSSETPGKSESDLMSQIYDYADDLKLNKSLVYEMKEAHRDDELFKYAFIHQCNALGEILPRLFEKIEDYTELLLPDHLLTTGSVIRELVENIDEEDFKDQVEIIGWMYQYYISEKKKEVEELLEKKNIKVTKENLPAKTQLFTPRWIVKYMVENSLGKLWLEAHPDSELKSKWTYYLDDEEQTPEVRVKLDSLINKNLKPEEITFLDPAMGSGHILVYAFDVMFEIYKHLGYMEREIAKLILEHNLYGLDIDDRAGQMAYFALMMKGRNKSASFFRQKIDPKVYAIQESRGITKDAIKFFSDPSATKLENNVHINQVKYLVDVFADGKTFGSILTVDPIDFGAIEKRIYEVEAGIGIDLEGMQHRDEIMMLLPLIQQAKVMARKYDVVSTNPPYMGRKGMEGKLVEYLDKNFKDSKSDLFAVFMESCLAMSKKNGRMAMINQHSWMFLSSYENLRTKLIASSEIQSMIHLGPRAFEEISGEVVQSTAFVIGNDAVEGKYGKYIKVVDEKTADGKERQYLKAIQNPLVSYRYSTPTLNFSKIPGSPIAYWASNNVMMSFDGNKIADYGETRKGMVTADNNRFIREWYELNINRICFTSASREQAIESKAKWFPYVKGGEFRRWYGNISTVVNWENDGAELLNMKGNGYNVGSTNHNLEYIFKEAIVWTKISSGNFTARYIPNGFLFDDASPLLSVRNKDATSEILAFMNSKVFQYYISLLNPTLNYSPGTVSNIPFKAVPNKRINEISNSCINSAARDWDSKETSWSFKRHIYLGSGYQLLTLIQSERDRLLLEERQNIKYLECELNKIYKELYKIEEIADCEISETEISISGINHSDDVRSFISYAVGCLFGRYSLDVEGLAYAGGEWDDVKYTCFKPNKNNTLVITDDKYFDDDIVERFIQFVRVAFGNETLEENLDFIAAALGNSGDTAREVIRNYFVKDFYKDHVKTYKGKPIYWLMDSGKQNGFKAILYLHRYKKDDIAMIRTEYLHELQKRYESHIGLLKRDPNPSVKVKKRIVDLDKKLTEIVTYDKVVAYLSHQQIELDLDDGIDVNYEKFQGVEIPQGVGMKPLKANLLAKR